MIFPHEEPDLPSEIAIWYIDRLTYVRVRDYCGNVVVDLKENYETSDGRLMPQIGGKYLQHGKYESVRKKYFVSDYWLNKYCCC